MHSFHQAISQSSNLNSSFHDFWPTPGNDQNKNDCLLRLHIVAPEQCFSITWEKMWIHFFSDIFRGQINTGQGVKFLRNKEKNLIWRRTFSELFWNKFQFWAGVRFCVKIHILLGCFQLLDRSITTPHFGYYPCFFFNVTHNYWIITMNI